MASHNASPAFLILHQSQLKFGVTQANSKHVIEARFIKSEIRGVPDVLDNFLIGSTYARHQ